MTNEDAEDDVEVISSDDEKIKLIGEIFSNDSSRKILKLISNDEEMTANEIAQKNNMSLALITHHLKRMQVAGMVKITKTEKSVKGQDMKYYLATKQSFLIVPPEKTTRFIINSVKKFSKFAAIGLAGFVSWMTLKPNDGKLQMQPTHGPGETNFTSGEQTISDESSEWSSSFEEPEVVEDTRGSLEPIPESEPSHSGVQNFDLSDSDAVNTGSVTLDRTVYPQPFDTTGAESVEPLILSIIIPVAVIIGGIILERILTRWLNKRKQNQISTRNPN
ncbi:MAG: helix-turn-helix transcriptional regulator [Thaumarchaeota archaeon]|nr:helix-turn-helix transcriptional regulator [Nitrososphaerota archaeon]